MDGGASRPGSLHEGAEHVTTDEILHRLHSGGERITIQRRAVIDALTCGTDHLTIQAIQQWLIENQAVRLSETTIYRILEWLKQVGIVSQTDMGAAGIVYSLISAPRHHHLICLTCGAVFMLNDDYFAELRAALLQNLRFAARIDHMAIYRQCERCGNASA